MLRRQDKEASCRDRNLVNPFETPGGADTLLTPECRVAPLVPPVLPPGIEGGALDVENQEDHDRADSDLLAQLASRTTRTALAYQQVDAQQTLQVTSLWLAARADRPLGHVHTGCSRLVDDSSDNHRHSRRGSPFLGIVFNYIECGLQTSSA